jgi:tellurite resistance-related uncharacterized protein
MRRLGRSHRYADAVLPERLRRWHAPRANRWERLCMIAGRLVVELLEADGVVTQILIAGDDRWIAPGVRWRVAQMDADTNFELEIHADDSSLASAPQFVRAALLDDADCMQSADEVEFAERLRELAPGRRWLVRARFDMAAAIGAAMANGTGTLCWHPLDAEHRSHTALVVRSAQAVGLADYLGRDHAVIEAALAGALRGDAERGRWLRNLLARHLVMEEDLLFPAWLEAGGNPGWARGLRNEHAHLRRDLDHLDDAVARRRFLLLLDGHDEKEEQIVYPDILARLGRDADRLAMEAMRMNLP